MCYGAAIGSSSYVKARMPDKVKKFKSDIDEVMDLQVDDSQAAWTLLSCSMSSQLNYLLSLQHPSDILEAAAKAKARLWSALEQLAGQARIPRSDEGLGFECVPDVQGVPGLQGRSYQRWISSQPVKLGGLGLRSLVETIPAAFVGSVERALPFMLGQEGERGLCPQLEEVVGRVEGEQRWDTFLAAGSRTAREFQQCWESLTHEARDISVALGEEQEGVLAKPVQSAGGDSVSGSTRKLAVQQLEKLRHTLLTKALEEHPDQLARPVMAFPNISDDKCAGAWLLATPSRDLGLSTPVFKEALSAHLCLPSPAVRDGGLVGKAVGTQGEVIVFSGMR